jgi:hypothetical protein
MELESLKGLLWYWYYRLRYARLLGESHEHRSDSGTNGS